MKGRNKKKTSLMESARKMLEKKREKRKAILPLPNALLKTPVEIMPSPQALFETPCNSSISDQEHHAVLHTIPPQSSTHQVLLSASSSTSSPAPQNQETLTVGEKLVDGRKRPREEDIMQQMLDMMKESNRREERMRKELDEQRSLIVEMSKSRSNYGDEESVSSGDLTNILVRERAVLECSRGQYKAGALKSVELPSSWPLYSWPKSWHVTKRQQMARALISMKDLQEQHVDVIKKKHVDELSHDEVMRKALDSALGELRKELKDSEIMGVMDLDWPTEQIVMKGRTTNGPFETTIRKLRRMRTYWTIAAEKEPALGRIPADGVEITSIFSVGTNGERIEFDRSVSQDAQENKGEEEVNEEKEEEEDILDEQDYYFRDQLGKAVPMYFWKRQGMPHPCRTDQRGNGSAPQNSHEKE